MSKPTSESSDLAKRIAGAVWDIEFGVTKLPAEWGERVADLISTSGLAELESENQKLRDYLADIAKALGLGSAAYRQLPKQVADLEARLAAAEHERDEARGRLEGIAKLVTPESGLPVLAKIYRLAADEGGKDGHDS